MYWENLKEQKIKCRTAICSFPYFDGWSEEALEKCVMLSKIQNYEPNEIIFGSGTGNPNNVYFILCGECQIVQGIPIVLIKTSKNKTYYRVHSADIPLKSGEKVEKRFFQVAIIKKGQSFGIGENMNDRRIVALNKVECLLCPRYWLMQNNKANIWIRIKVFLDKTIPTTEQIIREINNQKKWLEYRRSLVKMNLPSTLAQVTSFHDVPYSARLSLQ